MAGRFAIEHDCDRLDELSGHAVAESVGRSARDSGQGVESGRSRVARVGVARRAMRGCGREAKVYQPLDGAAAHARCAGLPSGGRATHGHDGLLRGSTGCDAAAQRFSMGDQALERPGA